jgi:tRNA U38,U39,U40 pseudouridine synthase TruA
LQQVRRTVGALINVAEGRTSVEEIRYMLENPSEHSWNNRIIVVPPYGLYLTDVEYDPLEMATSQKTVEQDHNNEPERVLCDQIE